MFHKCEGDRKEVGTCYVFNVKNISDKQIFLWESREITDESCCRSALPAETGMSVPFQQVAVRWIGERSTTGTRTCLETFASKGAGVWGLLSDVRLVRLSVLLDTSVIQVTATDADDPTYGNSARLVYSILQGQPYFSVESQTGDLHSRKWHCTKGHLHCHRRHLIGMYPC